MVHLRGQQLLLADDSGQGIQPRHVEVEVVDPVEVHGHVELLVGHLSERVVVGVRAVEKVDGDQRVRRLGVEGIQFLEDICIFRSIKKKNLSLSLVGNSGCLT